MFQTFQAHSANFSESFRFTMDVHTTLLLLHTTIMKSLTKKVVVFGYLWSRHTRVCQMVEDIRDGKTGIFQNLKFSWNVIIQNTNSHVSNKLFAFIGFLVFLLHSFVLGKVLIEHLIQLGQNSDTCFSSFLFLDANRPFWFAVSRC